MRNIALASDDNFATPLMVAVYSYFKSNPEPTRVHVLFENLSEKHIDSLRKIASEVSPDSEVVAHKIDPGKFEQREDCSVTSTATCVRYLIPEIIQDCDSVLYLDSDLVVVGNLEELFSLELGEDLIAGVQDDFVSTRPWGREMQTRYGVAAYVNAGVLLMNLRQMREEGVTAKFLNLDAGNNFPFRDQDVINAVCSGRVVLLDQKYNYFIFDGGLSAKIYHFAGNLKPWYVNKNNYQKAWWKNFEGCLKVFGGEGNVMQKIPTPNLSDADDVTKKEFANFMKAFKARAPGVGGQCSDYRALFLMMISQRKESKILSAYIRCFIDLCSRGVLERLMLSVSFGFLRAILRVKEVSCKVYDRYLCRI